MLFGRSRIGEILLSHGYVTQDQLNEALSAQNSEPGKRLGEKLIELKYVKEIDVVRALGLQFGMEVYETFDLDEAEISLSKDYNYNVAMKELIMPYQMRGNYVLTAIADPLNLEGVDNIRVLTGCEPILVLAPHAAVKNLITGIFDKLGTDLGQMADELDTQKPADEEEEAEKIEDILNRAASDDEGPIIQLMNMVFQQSMREHASDIHIEASEENVIFRFRVDGVLKEVARAPKRFHSAIIVRVKIMANLNIAEKRVPQDGRIRFKIAGRDIDVRVATAPAVHGERVTMRLLDQQAILRDLKDLGFNERHYHVITHAIAQPHGIVLVTGPTGSGKSTTLATLIDHINRTFKKHIITVEDPIEYMHQNRQSLVNQREVGSDTESFHTAMRYLLRQDPDVVLIGELRDKDSIETALTLAETGHLVLSTLHTNSCAQTINRIIDVFPAGQQDQIRTQLSFVLEGVVCQQLLLKASGKGRVVALEIMRLNAGIRNLIREDKVHMIYSALQLNRTKTGMCTMNQSLADLCLNRMITAEEAISHSSDVTELRQLLGLSN